MPDPSPLEPKQFLLTLWAASFAVQQFVEIVGDPLCTYWIQHRPPRILRRRSELDARTILNGLVSASAGILIALTCLHQGIFSVWAGQPHGLLDSIVTGFIIGAGTNGVNSLLKILQGTALSGLILNAQPPPAGGNPPGTQNLMPNTVQTTVGGQNFLTGQADVSNPTSIQNVLLHPAIASSAFAVDAPDDSPSAVQVKYVAQSCSEWCWAAVGSMISSLSWVPSGFMEECDVAACLFGGGVSPIPAQVSATIKPCCDGQATQSDTCNVPVQIHRVAPYLKIEGQYKTTADNPDYAQLTPSDVFNVINGTGSDPTPRPVAFLVQFNFAPAGHVVLATGMSVTDDSYTITFCDPEPSIGTSRLDYQEFTAQYPQNVEPDAGTGRIQWAYFPRR